MLDGFTHLERIKIMQEFWENRIPDYEYDSANEFDMPLNHYEVSTETFGG